MPWLVLKIQHNILAIWPAHAVWSQFDRSYFYGSDNFPRFQTMIIVERNCSSELCHTAFCIGVFGNFEVLLFEGQTKAQNNGSIKSLFESMDRFDYNIIYK